MTQNLVRRVVLVGFMGAGKTTVGRMLAERTGWAFEDLDDAIEARSGLSIDSWFRDHGEAAFRKEEAAAADELLQRDGLVLASGGGWAAEPGRLASLPGGTLSVWLDVDGDEAVRRVIADTVPRPLLRGENPHREARRLLASRKDAYASANVRVDTNGHSVEDVTSRILEILENAGTRTEAE